MPLTVSTPAASAALRPQLAAQNVALVVVGAVARHVDHLARRFEAVAGGADFGAEAGVRLADGVLDRGVAGERTGHAVQRGGECLCRSDAHFLNFICSP